VCVYIYIYCTAVPLALSASNLTYMWRVCHKLCVPHCVCDGCVSDSLFDISVSLSVCLSLPALVSNTIYTSHVCHCLCATCVCHSLILPLYFGVGFLSYLHIYARKGTYIPPAPLFIKEGHRSLRTVVCLMSMSHVTIQPFCVIHMCDMTLSRVACLLYIRPQFDAALIATRHNHMRDTTHLYTTSRGDVYGKTRA